jgi:prevent-host-death family protein
MNRIIGVTELQRRFRSVFDDVVKRGIPYVLTRGSRAEAVIIPYDDYERFQEFQERDVLDRFDRLVSRMVSQNADFSEEEVSADVEMAAREKRTS